MLALFEKCHGDQKVLMSKGSNSAMNVVNVLEFFFKKNEKNNPGLIVDVVF